MTVRVVSVASSSVYFSLNVDMIIRFEFSQYFKKVFFASKYSISVLQTVALFPFNDSNVTKCTFSHFQSLMKSFKF
jgi:hypothetical protein